MRNAAGTLAGILALVLLACSEITGIELATIGGAPANIEDVIFKAAAASGFVEADHLYPRAVGVAGGRFYQLPRIDTGNPVTIQVTPGEGVYRIRIGRATYGGYSDAELKVVSRFVSHLRENSVLLRKTWANKLKLSKDLESWLKRSGKHEA
jgi:hypothetical protein